MSDKAGTSDIDENMAKFCQVVRRSTATERAVDWTYQHVWPSVRPWFHAAVVAGMLWSAWVVAPLLFWQGPERWRSAALLILFSAASYVSLALRNAQLREQLHGANYNHSSLADRQQKRVVLEHDPALTQYDRMIIDGLRGIAYEKLSRADALPPGPARDVMILEARKDWASAEAVRQTPSRTVSSTAEADRLDAAPAGLDE